MTGAMGLAASFGSQPQYVSVVDDFVSQATGNPAVTATVTYALNPDGSRTNGTWLLLGANSDYEARVTVTSGALDSGSGAGSWLGLGTTRSWTCSVTNGLHQCTFTIEVRLASGGTVVGSATISLDAESLP